MGRDEGTKRGTTSKNSQTDGEDTGRLEEGRLLPPPLLLLAGSWMCMCMCTCSAPSTFPRNCKSAAVEWTGAGRQITVWTAATSNRQPATSAQAVQTCLPGSVDPAPDPAQIQEAAGVYY
ncbi:unnamed protein product [[Candida] boidinii]|uniref:Unnamed protein product n=1 Tax=Candida boidinii TaxID=5477 RepID=A0ACB5THA0_CANBO|nr:unnamed protein product [[Candida] boidinii]